MQPKLKTWVLFAGGTKFGEGRAELLRLIESEGSLKRAVERMGMSYRAAWGYLRELEAAAGFAFVVRSGTGPASGTRLTDEARAFLAAFESYRSKLDAATARAFAAAFSDSRPGRGRGVSPRARPSRAASIRDA